jgi:branched-subunit amino acid transport protein
VNIWLVMLLGGALTFLMRLSFIYLSSRIRMPDLLQRALKYVPPAVLTALVAPALFFPDGALDVSLHNNRLLAGIAAVAVAGRTKSTLWTILAGMGALLILTAVSGQGLP